MEKRAIFPDNVLTRILNRTVGGSNNLEGPALLKDLGGLVVPQALLRVHVVPWIIRGAETLNLAKGKYVPMYFSSEKFALF